ncbi:MAG: single-stranded DNA-binding protein [Planctomycetota bacterium]
MKANGLARIGKDAEIRFTKDGTAVANVSLAFTYGKKGDDGKRPTQWVEASLWGQRAESMKDYLTKGKQIVAYLEDVSLQTYTKGDGTQQTKMVARLSDLEFVSEGDGQRAAPAQPQRQPQRQTSAPQGSGFDDMENDLDIPF